MNRIESGLAEFSSAFSLYSTAFWVAWITIIYSGDSIVVPLGDAYATTAQCFTISTFCLGVTLVAAAALSSRAARIISSKRALYGLALLCGCATLGVSWAGALPEPLFYVCSAATGIATAFIALKGISLYADVSTKRSAMTSCFSLMIGILVYCLATVSALSFSAEVVALETALMPLLSVFIAFVPANEDSGIEDAASDVLSQAFWRFVAFLAVMTFFVSTVRGFYPRLLDTAAFSSSRGQVAVALIVMSAAICLLLARKPQNSSFGRLYYLLFVAAVLMMVPMVLFGSNASLAGVLASLSNGLLCLMAWNFLARMSYCTGMSSIRVFGFGYGMLALAMTAGFVAGDFFFALLADGKYVMAFLALLMVGCGASLLLVRERDIRACMAPTVSMIESVNFAEGALEDTGQVVDDDQAVSAHGNDGEGSRDEEMSAEESPRSGKHGRFMLKCAGICEEYGLSSRESEVFVLLAKSKEAKAIAEELFISFNTARTHIRKIYAKLGVHSRRELMELIEHYRV